MVCISHGPALPRPRPQYLSFHVTHTSMTRGKAKTLDIALPSTSLVACQRVRTCDARSYRPIAAEPWTTNEPVTGRQRSDKSPEASHCGGSRFEAADQGRQL
jgi:hypothetical protein